MAAERSPFMGRLLRGQADRREYVAYLASLEPVYAALEESLPNTPAWVRVLHPAALLRHDALLEDLSALRAGADLPSAAPAALDLAYRVRAVVDRPSLWVAHAWVRYMGDLSGGQMLGRIVARSFGLETDAGTAFYRFPGLPDVDAFKTTYRAGLDGAPLDAAEVAAAAEEARASFAAHQRIFTELESGLVA